MESNQFLLSLPIKHAHTIQTKEQVVPEESFESQEAKEEVDSQNRYTLLVVEDSLEMQAFIVKQLSAKYRVLTALNGVEALKVLEEHTVNLVISDVMMPEMDGLELCEHLKSAVDYSHIPVILLTAMVPGAGYSGRTAVLIMMTRCVMLIWLLQWGMNTC